MTATAHAHEGHASDRTHHAWILYVSEENTRLVCTIELGDNEARAMAFEFDRDGDRSISRAEANALLDRIGAQLAAELDVELDGSAIRSSWSNGYVDPVDVPGRPPRMIELVLQIPTHAREHQLRLLGRSPLLHADSGELTIWVEDDTRVECTAPLGTSSRCQSPSIRGDSSLTVDLCFPGRTSQTRRWSAVCAVAFLAFMAALALSRPARS